MTASMYKTLNTVLYCTFHFLSVFFWNSNALAWCINWMMNCQKNVNIIIMSKMNHWIQCITGNSNAHFSLWCSHLASGHVDYYSLIIFLPAITNLPRTSFASLCDICKSTFKMINSFNFQYDAFQLYIEYCNVNLSTCMQCIYYHYCWVRYWVTDKKVIWPVKYTA